MGELISDTAGFWESMDGRLDIYSDSTLWRRVSIQDMDLRDHAHFEQIRIWCDENGSDGRYALISMIKTIFVEKEEDAVLVTLKWG